jgi:phosphoserine phosphatase
MPKSDPETATARGALTRRTLLGAGSAALLGVLLPLPGGRVAAIPTAAEVAIAPSHLAMQSGDPLPSWNDGPRKQAILDFVAAATNEGTTDFVPIPDRVATFDMDGTLWVEMPLYVQSTFSLDRIKAMVPEHPEWQTTPPFDAVFSHDEAALVTFSNNDWQQIMGVTHAGLTIEEYVADAAGWLAATKHSRFDRLYTELVYEPMLDVMAYLRQNDFRTYIVSGSGAEFMRAFAESAFGVPPEQVIGTTFELTYAMGDNGVPTITIDEAVLLDDNNAGKPQDIAIIIGRRPAAAFGNSTGDQQMLEWTGAGERATLMMLVYHDDPVREYAYGPAGGLANTHIGTFTEALMDEANERGWFVISMKDDWGRIFSWSEAGATPVAGG